jgi:ubiquinone/menaquinone biosynthesis C-methylase UbiE
MPNPEMDEVRAFWDRNARDWQIQVGDTGDSNRMMNSDPVLWSFAGEVSGLTVLDAGCGTGYLTKLLADRGAKVIGVDLSERMIEVARAQSPGIDFRVDSCSELSTIPDSAFDLLVSNYVLMDTPDLDGTLRAFHRVLKPGGAAVLVFSHPCFPQGAGVVGISEDGDGVTYAWSFPYFTRRKCIDPPWSHFTTDFIWFHRPLSDYWRAFKSAGFTIEEFDEPRVTEERYGLAESPSKLQRNKVRPYSVAFKLRK